MVGGVANETMNAVEGGSLGSHLEEYLAMVGV